MYSPLDNLTFLYVFDVISTVWRRAWYGECTVCRHQADTERLEAQGAETPQVWSPIQSLSDLSPLALCVSSREKRCRTTCPTSASNRIQLHGEVHNRLVRVRGRLRHAAVNVWLVCIEFCYSWQHCPSAGIAYRQQCSALPRTSTYVESLRLNLLIMFPLQAALQFSKIRCIDKAILGKTIMQARVRLNRSK